MKEQRAFHICSLKKCPPIPLDKMLLFIMPFLKRAFCQGLWEGIFGEQMEIDPPTTAGADQMRRPNKMLSSRDKD